MRDGEEKQEIIIVKRYGGGDDGHHGGAWKIAFADFMTAMMALFLVLWLVNAANEETKKSVASYFNPVKLVDRNRSSKGLDEPKRGEGQQDEGEGSQGQPEDEEKSRETRSDTELFRDPFRVLDEIADEVSIDTTNVETDSPETEIDAFEPVASEDVFADPFAQVIIKKKEQPPSAPLKLEVREEKTIQSVERQPPVVASKKEPAEEKPKTAPEKTDVLAQVSKEEEEGNQPEAAEKEARQEKLEELSKEITKEIKDKLASVLGKDERITESLSVEVTNDGILISITDQFGFSMFQIGSAVPKGELVLVMQEISNVLAQKKGGVRIYGHTDARPYGSGDYDNWRLSTARAHAARFMLVRGGLTEPRISQVAGFADRKLRQPSMPEADINRRIEILLEVS